MCECSRSLCVCVYIFFLQLSWELALAMFNCALGSSKNSQCAKWSLESHCPNASAPRAAAAALRGGGW